MQNHSEHIEYLWRQYLSGKASNTELDELFRLNSQLDDAEQSASIEQVLAQFNGGGELDAEVRERILHDILNAGEQGKLRVSSFRRWRWVAAASVLLVLVAGVYWFINDNKKETSQSLVVKPQDIQPGKTGAVLTLADGTQVLLDAIRDSTLMQQGASNATISNGNIAYRQQEGSAIVYNTIQTPKGRQYQLTLADNSKVWLNASSSIRYPTSFPAGERVVHITGEAYFEVADNKQSPFKVNISNRASVEVLGTSFNISAYENEQAINTTLLQGAVRVRDAASSVVLKPGQQALITDAVRIAGNADIDKVMAWQRGFFNFEGASLEEVMKQLERWYDIEVVYADGIPDIEFGGEFTRDMSLSGVLLALEKAGTRYRLEGRKLIVLPR